MYITIIGRHSNYRNPVFAVYGILVEVPVIATQKQLRPEHQLEEAPASVAAPALALPRAPASPAAASDSSDGLGCC